MMRLCDVRGAVQLSLLLMYIAGGAHAAGLRNEGSSTTEHQYSRTEWHERGQEEIKKAMQLEDELIKTKAKNIILVVGDGMGISTVTAARWYKSMREKTPIATTRLVWEEMPHVGLSKTYNVDSIVPDSAGTASAMMSGEKAWEGVSGLNYKVPRGDCQAEAGNRVKTVLDHAVEQGKSTGIVTTTTITHATPSAAYAHIPDRFWERDSQVPDRCKGITKDIALQLVEDNPDINVLFGGGRKHLLPNNTADPVESELMGLREDNRNLLQEWKQDKIDRELNYKSVFTPADFVDLNTSKVDYVLGLMDYSNIGNNYLRKPGQPSLAEMTAKALKILQRNKNGYFLLAEEGHIDYAHHYNKAQLALDDTLALDETVKVIMEMTDPEDTLLIVTADHSHVFTLAGYTEGNNTGLLEMDSKLVSRDGKPYLTMSYANGPGFVAHRMNNGTEIPRRNITELGDQIYDMEYVSDAGVDRKFEAHGGEEVAIYARGPWSHLFHATHDQTYIGHVMMHAGCFSDPRAGHCVRKTATTNTQLPPQPCGATTVNRYTLPIVIVILFKFIVM